MNQIKIFEPGILETAVDKLFDVIRWIRLIQRELRTGGPLQVLRRDFGGGIEMLGRVGPHSLTQKVLASPLSVSIGSVKEVAA